MRKIVILSALMLAQSIAVFSYTGDKEKNLARRLFLLPVLKDSISVPDDEKVSKNYLDLGVDYYSNTNAYGHFNSFSAMPAFDGSATYTTLGGFSLGLTYTRTMNSDSTFTNPTSDLNASLGYSVNFLKFFSYDVSYMHFWYSKNSTSLKAAYTDQLSTGLGYDFNWFVGSASVAYLLGNQPALYLTLSNSFSIEADGIISDDDMLLIQPGCDIMFSSQQSYLTYLYKLLGSHPKLFKRLKSKYPSLSLTELESASKKESFQASSVNVNLPVSYSTGNITVSATLSGYKDINQLYVLTSGWQVMFQAGIIYSFDW